MGLKRSGETIQSLNNSSRRCAQVRAIFSPPGFALPKWGAGREAIVFTTGYVRQWGAKAEHTVGLSGCAVRRHTHVTPVECTVSGSNRTVREVSSMLQDRRLSSR